MRGVIPVLKRVLAFIIDALVLFVTSSVIRAFKNAVIVPELVFIAMNLICLAYLLLYFPWQWVRYKKTLGMRLFKLRIVREDGGTLTKMDAFIRCCFCAWDLVGFAGLFLIYFKGRTIADMAAKTKVIPAEAN
ncbi:MAG TPA: RDD family protein [Chitinophagales bacterium]|nr:RDD family protein [Chitinophagales bacterium]